MDSKAPQTRRPWRAILVVAALVLLLVVGLLWLNRRTIAREALTGWLEARGVPAEAEVEAFGPGVFRARLRIGDPKRPDFTANRADVRYRFKGLGVEVTSVTLREPVLRASVRGGRLSLGSLDPIIEEFRRRPPQPDAARPRIVIDGGALLLATDYGPVRLTADARVEDGKLMALAAVGDPARLQGRGLDARLGRSRLDLVTRGGRVDVRLDAPMTALAAGGLTAQAARLRVSAAAPYPDLEKKRGDGAVVLRADLGGGRVAFGGQALEGAALQLAFTGQAQGWIPDLAVTGRATASLKAASGEMAGGRLQGLEAAMSAPDVSWTRRGGDRLRAGLTLTARVERAAAAGARIERAALALRGEAQAFRGRFDVAMSGSALGRGAYDLGAPTSEDSSQMVAVKRAARGFRFAAPDLSLGFSDEGPSLRLAEPLRILPDQGGEVRIDMPGEAVRITARGGGLPDVEAQLTQVSLDGGFSAALALKAGLSIGPLEGGRIDAAGRLRIAEGVSFTGVRCATVTAERLELGESDVERLAGRLCPADGPMFAMTGADWRIAGRAEAVSASAPFLQARIEDAAGPVSLGVADGRLNAEARIAQARVEDQAPETRFNPLAMTGTAQARRDVWTAELDFRTPAGQPVARASLQHDGPSGQGRVDIDTGVLRFAEGGLQPSQLSPLTVALGSPATGEARFQGGFAWNPLAGISAGTLTIPRLDFQSPAGRVTGLSGTVVLTSLAPLVAAPGQELRAERLDAIVPVTGLQARFGLQDEVLRIAGGEAAVGGGRVLIESLELPLAQGASTRGVLVFEGVQLHDLVEASPFAESVELTARVSGRIPFEATGSRVRILAGELKAIEPGRLSIRREAIAGVQAQGALEGPAPAAEAAAQPDTFTDFAYQAMENLAFDELSATVASRSDGRLGVLFHIKGRHDPPQRQEIRLTLLELIQRRFMERQLPLPSDVGVNLTLDTTLNLDDLMADFAEYQRLRGSGPVQP